MLLKSQKCILLFILFVITLFILACPGVVVPSQETNSSDTDVQAQETNPPGPDIPPQDTNSPVAGWPGSLTASDVMDTTLTISWPAATDDLTAAENLEYIVYYSDANNITSVSDIESHGTAFTAYEKNITYKDLTGLSPSVNYYFNIIVKDEAGNKTAYKALYQPTQAVLTPVVPTITRYSSDSFGTYGYLYLTFSVSMKQTETQNAIYSADGLDFTYKWNATNTQLTITTTTPLPAGTDYDLIVKAGAQSVLGLNLAADYPCILSTNYGFGNSHKISGVSTRAYGPSIVWNGSSYGVSWEDERDGNFEIYFARFDIDGSIIGSELRVTEDSAASESAKLIWNGSEYALTWMDDRDGAYEIYFVRIDSDGNKIGNEIAVTASGMASVTPVISWDNINNQYCIMWADYRHGMSKELYAALLNSSGAKIGDDIRITSLAGDSSFPDLVWNGTGYAFAWMDTIDSSMDFNIYFSTMSDACVPSDDIINVSYIKRHYSSTPSLVWTGVEYGISWIEDDNILFCRVNNSGLIIGSAILVSQSAYVSDYTDIAWTGTRYILAWTEKWHRIPQSYADVYFAEINPLTNRLSKRELIGGSPDSNILPSLIYNGSDVTVAWQKYVSGNYGYIYLSSSR